MAGARNNSGCRERSAKTENILPDSLPIFIESHLKDGWSVNEKARRRLTNSLLFGWRWTETLSSLPRLNILDLLILAGMLQDSDQDLRRSG